MALAAPAPGATTERVGGVLVTVLPGPQRPSGGSAALPASHGYAMHRVALDNTTNRPRTVRLTLPARSFGGGGSNHVALKRAVKLAAGATTTVPLFQPAVPIDGGGLLAEVGEARVMLDWRGGRHASDDRAPYTMLVSARLTDRSGRLETEVVAEDGQRHAIDLRASNPMAKFIRRDAPGDWPEDWLAYSRYEAVIVLGEELERLAPAARSALRRYVVAGGLACVLGDWSPPGDWPIAPASDASSPGPVHYDCGFGRLVISPLAEANRLNGALRDLLTGRAAPWGDRLGVMEANDRFPVVDELGVPVRGMLVLLVVFALAMGPVNMLVLGRMNRRIWMLWTAIALAASGLVWGYAIFSEGWTGRERTAGLTFLNQKTQTATTIGWAAFYSPLTPGGGLGFERTTELTPQLGERDRRPRYPRRGRGRTTGERARGRGRTTGGRARVVDWTRQQHLSSGWIVARVPAHFKLRKSATHERRAVTFSRGAASGGVEAVNALGVDIERLIYRDADGRVYQTTNLPAGQKQTLTPMPNAGPPTIDPSGVYQGRWMERFAAIRTRPEEAAPRGGYVAILNNAPFIESALDGARRRARSIVIGLTEAGHDRIRAEAMSKLSESGA